MLTDSSTSPNSQVFWEKTILKKSQWSSKLFELHPCLNEYNYETGMLMYEFLWLEHYIEIRIYVFGVKRGSFGYNGVSGQQPKSQILQPC